MELARTKMQVRELELKLIRYETLYPVVTPVTDLTMIERGEYLERFRQVGISSLALLDSKLSITSKVELDRMAPYLVYPADFYAIDIWDCEDYGIQAQCDAGHKFGVNGVRLGLGNVPGGYHGFVITMDKDGNIWWLEPNAGFEYAGVWYKIGMYGYQPDKVFA